MTSFEKSIVEFEFAICGSRWIFKWHSTCLNSIHSHILEVVISLLNPWYTARLCEPILLFSRAYFPKWQNRIFEGSSPPISQIIFFHNLNMSIPASRHPFQKELSFVYQEIDKNHAKTTERSQDYRINKRSNWHQPLHAHVDMSKTNQSTINFSNGVTHKLFKLNFQGLKQIMQSLCR